MLQSMNEDNSHKLHRAFGGVLFSEKPFDEQSLFDKIQLACHEAA